MEDICRLCGLKESNLKSAFAIQNGRLLADMISIICPIKIDISDEFSKSICISCIEIIVNAVELREKCVLTQESFKNGDYTQQPLDIKLEKDPFTSALSIEDSESQSNIDDDESEEFTDYYPQVSLEKDRINCPHCPQTFTYPHNLTRHIINTHNGVETRPSRSKTNCNICGKIISHKTNLKRHMVRFHSNDLPFECSECFKRFPQENRLIAHMRKEHGQGETERCSCVTCNRIFPSKESLDKHIQIKHRPPENSINGCFPCTKCDKSFTMRHNLNRHHKRFHSDELNFHCTQCNDRFKSQLHLNRHVFRIHDSKSGILSSVKEIKAPEGEIIIDKFQYCNQDFNGSKYRYERHVINMHGDQLEVIYSCDICPKKFVYLKSLKFHIEVHRKKMREEKFPHQCQLCLRRFLSEEKYKFHITNTHANSTFICYICGKSFRTNAHLENHIKRHNDVRNYQCSQCDLKFFQPRDLDRHLSTHSDIRPYVCTYENCGKSFKLPDIYRKHVKRVHKEIKMISEMQDNSD